MDFAETESSDFISRLSKIFDRALSHTHKNHLIGPLWLKQDRVWGKLNELRLLFNSNQVYQFNQQNRLTSRASPLDAIFYDRADLPTSTIRLEINLRIFQGKWNDDSLKRGRKMSLQSYGSGNRSLDINSRNLHFRVNVHLEKLKSFFGSWKKAQSSHYPFGHLIKLREFRHFYNQKKGLYL